MLASLNEMINPEFIVWNSVVYSTIFLLFFFIVLKIKPRLLLHSYPPEIKEKVSPKTAGEIKKTKILAIPFMVLFVLLPIFMVIHYKLQNNAPINYWGYLLYFMSLLHLMNMVDLVILDGLVFGWITPKFILIPGTGPGDGYKNFRFYFIGFLKGLLICSLAAAVLSLFTYGIGYIL